MTISNIGPKAALYPQNINTSQKTQTQKQPTINQSLLPPQAVQASQPMPSGGQLIQAVLKSFLENLGSKRGAPTQTESVTTASTPIQPNPVAKSPDPTNLNAQQADTSKLAPVSASYPITPTNPFMQAKIS